MPKRVFFILAIVLSWIGRDGVRAQQSCTCPTFVTYTVPASLVNGTNTVYTVAAQPIPGSIQVYLNGVMEHLGVDYTTAGARITFLFIPQSGDFVFITYLK